jgi:hypothetical protein
VVVVDVADVSEVHAVTIFSGELTYLNPEDGSSTYLRNIKNIVHNLTV